MQFVHANERKKGAKCLFVCLLGWEIDGDVERKAGRGTAEKTGKMEKAPRFVSCRCKTKRIWCFVISISSCTMKAVSTQCGVHFKRIIVYSSTLGYPSVAKLYGPKRVSALIPNSLRCLGKASQF